MSLRRTFNKFKLDVKHAAPGIMVVASIGFGIAAIVEFCRKSREAAPVVDEYKETVAELTESHRITHDDASYRKDIVTETAKTGLKLAKIYAKPAALYLVSVGLNVKSYDVMQKRNAAVVAAYASVGNSLRNLYSRISERYGEDALYELKHGIKKVEVSETRIDATTGEEVTETSIVPVYAIDDAERPDPNVYSPYARFFDDASPAWRKDSEYNLTYLLEVEADCNRILKTEGFLFLNDVYEKCGIPKTRAGQKVGWRYYPKGNNPCGDNRVSLGLHDIRRPAVRDFVNGYESVVIIDPNVDGEILYSLPKL